MVLKAISLKSIIRNNAKLIKRVIIITTLILGITGYLLSIISLYFPWGSTITKSLNGGRWQTNFYFNDFFGHRFIVNSVYIDGMFGIMILIGLVIIWWKNNTQVFSSFITLGVLSIPVRFFYTLVFFVRYSKGICGSVIPEYNVIGCWTELGAYVNLTATIFFLFMGGLSILGFILFRNEVLKQRVFDVKGNSIIYVCALSLISLVFFSTYSFHESGDFYPHIVLILITVVILVSSFIKDIFSRNIIIPSYLMVLGIELILPEILRFQYPELYGNYFSLKAFFILETSLVLFISGLLLYGNGSTLKSQPPLISLRKERILNVMFLSKLLRVGIIILLGYCLIGWLYNGIYWNFHFIIGNLILKTNPQAIIFLGVLAPLLLLTIFRLFTHGVRFRKINAQNRKSGTKYIFLFVYFIGVLRYIYIIFYVFFFPHLSDEIQDIYSPFSDNLVSLFIPPILVAMFIPFVFYLIYLNVEKIRRIKKKLKISI